MTETSAEAPQEPPVHPEPMFIRPTEGRVIAGVCAGIANRYNFDVAVVRIVMVGLTVLSGLGAVLYLAAWLLIPSSDGPAAIQPGSRASHLASRVPTWLLVVGVALLALTSLHFSLHGGWWAIAVIAILLAVRRARVVLLSLLILVVAAAGALAAAGPHIATRNHAVTSVEDLHGTYWLAAGRLNLDLSQLTLGDTDETVHVRVGRGAATVTLPAGVPMHLHASTGLGSVIVAGQKADGLGAEVTRDLDLTPDAHPRLNVDVLVAAGSARVTGEEVTAP